MHSRPPKRTTELEICSRKWKSCSPAATKVSEKAALGPHNACQFTTTVTRRNVAGIEVALLLPLFWLCSRKIANPTGKKWHAATVIRVQKRIGDGFRLSAFCGAISILL